MSALAVAFSNARRKPRGTLTRDILLKIGRTLQIEFQPPRDEPEWLVRALAELKRVAG